MGGSRDYLNIKRQDEQQALQRAERLADVESQRNYAGQRFDVERKAHIEDAATLEEQRAVRALHQALIQKGYLKPGDDKDPQKVQAAYEKAQKDGLIDRYDKLIEAGFLDPADVADPKKVQEAERQVGERGKQKRESEDTAKSNASSEVTRLRDEGLAIQDRIVELQSKLSQPGRQPTSAEIENYARQMVANQKGVPETKVSDAEVQQALGAAAKELRGLYQQQDILDSQDAKREMDSLRSQLQYNTIRQDNIGRDFKVAPAAVTAAQAARPASPAMSGPTQRPKGGMMSQFLNKVTAPQGSNPAANNPGIVIPTDMQPLPNTVNDPMIAQENERRATKFHQINVIDPLTEAQQQLNNIDQQIARRQKPVTPIQGIPMVMGGQMGVPMVNSENMPMAQQLQAVDLSKLYQDRELAKKRLASLQAQLQVAPAMAPMTPTPSISRAASDSVLTTNSQLNRPPAYSPLDLAPAY